MSWKFEYLLKSDVINKLSHSPQPKLSTYPPLTLPSRSYHLWHRSLFKELSFPIAATSIIFTDNQDVISISHHLEFHARMIDINLHFLCDLTSQEILDTIYVNTHDNLADLSTKGLLRQQHEDLTYRIGVLSGHGGVLE